jgi:hypothetical protein
VYPYDLGPVRTYVWEGDYDRGEIPIGPGEFGLGGEAGRIEALTAEAEELYPKLANKIHRHHVLPKYLGGTNNGTVKAINAAYHQFITNAFRALAPYGEDLERSEEEIQQILKTVYSMYPLP